MLYSGYDSLNCGQFDFYIAFDLSIFSHFLMTFLTHFHLAFEDPFSIRYWLKLQNIRSNWNFFFMKNFLQ